jgi:hypothetical protein
VSSNSGGLRTPAGLLIKSNQLVVSGQNAGSTDPGQILRYDLKIGAFAGALVPQTNPHPAFAPRGIIIKDGVLIVANIQGRDPLDRQCPPICPGGDLLTYEASTGRFLGSVSHPVDGEFHPRSVVAGPDGRIYVSIRNLPEPCGGSIFALHPAGSATGLLRRVHHARHQRLRG